MDCDAGYKKVLEKAAVKEEQQKAFLSPLLNKPGTYYEYYIIPDHSNAEFYLQVLPKLNIRQLIPTLKPLELKQVSK